MIPLRGRSRTTVPATGGLISGAATLLGALLLTACDFGAPKAEPPKPEPLPQEVCAKAREAIAGLEKTGALVLNAPTDAIVPQQAWLQMAPAAKDALLTAMAIAATCAAEPRLEQEVTVHSETGTVLGRRVVQTSYSVAEALGS
jgi:hypothetical protein